MVAFHGFMGVGVDFTPLAERLGMSMYAPDLIGHGTFQSDNPLDYTLERQLSYWAERLPDRFTLVGYSMGGRLALQFALRYPKRLKRLVLIGATPGILEPVERSNRGFWDRSQAERIRELGIEGFYNEWQELPIIATQEGIAPDIRTTMKQNRLAQSIEGLANSMIHFGTGTMPSCWDLLPTLSVPTVLMVGTLDIKYRDIATRMLEYIPAGVATCVLVSNVGHCAHLEGLTEATEHLREWLNI